MGVMHTRNPEKHEYEVQVETRAMVHAGNREDTAVHLANEVLAAQLNLDCVRVYHTYPSPGPVRRYVGMVKRDGKLHRFA